MASDYSRQGGPWNRLHMLQRLVGLLVHPQDVSIVCVSGAAADRAGGHVTGESQWLLP